MHLVVVEIFKLLNQKKISCDILFLSLIMLNSCHYSRECLCALTGQALFCVL